MSDYILDWKASHLDGDNTLNGVDGNIGVHIATPENADWDSWGIGEVGGQHDQLIANCVNDPTVVTATFDAPIENVTFELLDVDSDNCNWDDRVTIIAKDAHGNIVPVQFSDLEAHHHVNGGVLNTTGDSGENNVTVTIPGPIVSLEIILDNGAGAEYSGKVGVGDLHFDLAGGAQDGYVDGTAGDDVIDAGYDNDPDGDKIDSNDALLPGEAPQDDVVLAGAGDDLVLAGDGNDEVYGGTGDDTLCGQDGDDVMYGGQGADRLEGMRGNDLLFGQAGNDVITGDQGNDVLVGDAGDDALFGGSGKDVAHGGTGDDTLAMGSGNDVAYGGAGADTISGGDGDDTLIGGGRSFNGTLDFNDLSKGDLVNGQYLGQGVHISSADPHNPVMIFDSANPTGGDHDLETNNLGNVLILSEDRDGADPDDNASGGTFVFEFDGPAFVDNIRMLDMEQAGEIRLYDVDGNLFKTITTGTSGDNGQFTQIICEHGVLRMEIDLNGSGALDNLSYVLDGTADDAGDVIDGGAGDDYIAGQAGDDVLTGGAGADEIFGGDDADLIIGGNDGDVVDGGTGGNDNDTLDLTDQGPLRVINQTQDADGNSTSGTIEFLDADGNVTGSMDFFEIENLLLPENTGPDAVDDSASTQEDTAVTIPVLGNDSDPEGDTLTVTEATSPDGDVVINPDGTITFTPNPDFNGDAEITYTITDGNGNEDTATVTVTVSPVNDDPDAVDDTASTDEDSPVTIDVLGNDSDVDGDPLTVTEATSPDGDVTINPDGTITFTPNPDFTGEAIITYTVDDGNGGTDTAIVTVTVGAVNDDPDAVDSTYVVSQNETDGDTDGNAITDDTGAGKDSDPDGDTLTVAKVGGAVAGVGAVVAGSNGGLFTIGENGAIDFDANGEFDALADGETAETTVSYTISDGNGGTDTANVTFIVQGTNDGPVATDNAYIVDRSEAAGDVDGNVITDDTGDGVDSDPEGQDLSVIAVNGSTGNVSNAVTGDNGGSFVINPDGTVDFIAGDDFDDLGLGESVTTSVTYTISDGNGGTDTGVASFTVTGTNDGTVEGTSGADLIDVDYLGDPDGDRVDNNDAILPGDKGDDDLIFGYEGDDSIIAGNGDDEVYGGIGDDQISSGTGNDTVFGDDGNDVIDTSNPNADALPDVGYPGLYPADTDPNNDLDTAFGGAGDDTIFTGDDNDIIFGGSGNDIILGAGEDQMFGGPGDDVLVAQDGDNFGEQDLIGGSGSDLFVIEDVTSIQTGSAGVTALDFNGLEDRLVIDLPDGRPASALNVVVLSDTVVQIELGSTPIVELRGVNLTDMSVSDILIRDTSEDGYDYAQIVAG